MWNPHSVKIQCNAKNVIFAYTKDSNSYQTGLTRSYMVMQKNTELHNSLADGLTVWSKEKEDWKSSF